MVYGFVGSDTGRKHCCTDVKKYVEIDQNGGQIHPKSIQNPSQIDENVFQGRFGSQVASRVVPGRRRSTEVLHFFDFLAGNGASEGGFRGPLKTDNATKTDPLRQDRRFGPPKMPSGEGSGKNI